MSPNIPGNILKHSREYLQTFRGMSSSIPGNITKHSGGCGQTFRGMSSNIPGNIAKHSGECPIYFDGRELVEASPITVVFSGALLIVCSVIFYVENLAKLLDAKLNSGGNLISMPWKSFEKFELVSATQDSVSNHRSAISFFFSGRGSRSAPGSSNMGVVMGSGLYGLIYREIPIKIFLFWWAVLISVLFTGYIFLVRCFSVYIDGIFYIIGFINMLDLCFGFRASVVFPRILGQRSRMLLVYLGRPRDLCLGLVFIVCLSACGSWYVNGTVFESTGEL